MHGTVMFTAVTVFLLCVKRCPQKASNEAYDSAASGTCVYPVVLAVHADTHLVLLLSKLLHFSCVECILPHTSAAA